MPDDHITELANRAARHALAMRMHGATLRGVAGAELLEDLADALGGRYNPETDQGAPEPEDVISVDEALRMLDLDTQVELARKLGVKPETVTQWKARGRIPGKNIKMIRRLYRGMQVAT